MSIWKHLLLTFIVSTLAAIAVVYGYHRRYAPRIIAVDVRGYVAEQRKLYLEGKLSQKDLDANLSHLRTLVDKLPDNATAIVSDVVIKNEETLKLKQ